MPPYFAAGVGVGVVLVGGDDVADVCVVEVGDVTDVCVVEVGGVVVD